MEAEPLGPRGVLHVHASWLVGTFGIEYLASHPEAVFSEWGADGGLWAKL